MKNFWPSRQAAFANYGAPELLERVSLGARSRRSLVRSRAAQPPLRGVRLIFVFLRAAKSQQPVDPAHSPLA